jgi:Fur family peroxide stress response transcriptional regulator
MLRRNTRQRDAILNILRNTDSHPTADWVYEQARKIIPGISKGTVYRNLNLLKEAGEISELNLSGTMSRYEGKPENHYHFRCEQCGRVFDLDQPVNKDLDNEIAAKTGFKVSYHQLEFRGLCHDCQKKQKMKGEK